MRGVLFAIAVTLMTGSAASASSFVVLGEAKPVEATIGSAGSSVVVLGASQAPVAITSDQVDPTETASTNTAGIDPRTEDAPRAKPRAAVVAAEWARLSAIDTRSMVFFGTPDPELFKTPEEQTASLDPTKIPMVMRGGIEGGAFAESPKAKDEAATEASKDATKPSGEETSADAEAGVKKKPAGESAQPDATAQAQPTADQPAKTEQ